MTPLLPRFLRTAYRKEPVSSFILIMAAVDVAIGGVGEWWSLVSVGILLALLAGGVRWWQGQKIAAIPVAPKPRRYLPPARQPLPLLTRDRQPR